MCLQIALQQLVLHPRRSLHSYSRETKLLLGRFVPFLGRGVAPFPRTIIDRLINFTISQKHCTHIISTPPPLFSQLVSAICTQTFTSRLGGRKAQSLRRSGFDNHHLPSGAPLLLDGGVVNHSKQAKKVRCWFSPDKRHRENSSKYFINKLLQ